MPTPCLPECHDGHKSVAMNVRGLYAITPDFDDPDLLAAKVRLFLAGGGRLLQYRNKRANADLKMRQAQLLRTLTCESGACFIVNDDSALAFSVGADGVHLGRDDGHPQRIAQLRAESRGAAFIVGVSCYGDLARAREAVDHGADYVAFGSFFPSSTKPNAVRPEITLLREARLAIQVPIVAIGGITLDNAATLIEAGADAIAVVTALFDAPDIATQTQRLTRLFPHHV